MFLNAYPNFRKKFEKTRINSDKLARISNKIIKITGSIDFLFKNFENCQRCTIEKIARDARDAHPIKMHNYNFLKNNFGKNWKKF